MYDGAKDDDYYDAVDKVQLLISKGYIDESDYDKTLEKLICINRDRNKEGDAVTSPPSKR